MRLAAIDPGGDFRLSRREAQGDLELGVRLLVPAVTKQVVAQFQCHVQGAGPDLVIGGKGQLHADGRLAGRRQLSEVVDHDAAEVRRPDAADDDRPTESDRRRRLAGAAGRRRGRNGSGVCGDRDRRCLAGELLLVSKSLVVAQLEHGG